MATSINETEKGLVLKLTKALDIPEKYQENFAKRVGNLFKNTGFSFNRALFETWAKSVYDPNPLHQDAEYAKSLGFGFTDTPVFGTLISSRGELLTSKIINEINLVNSREVLYSGSEIKYGEPLYPGEVLLWTPEKLKIINDEKDETKVLGVDLVFKGSKGEEKIITNTTRFRYNENTPGEEIRRIVSGEDSNVIAEYEFEIGPDRFAGYNQCTGNIPSENPMMLGVAIVPAGLLKLCYDKNGNYQGVYRRMNLEFYQRPSLGNFKVAIKSNSKPREKGGMFNYNFKGVVSQEGEPILSGDFRCVSAGKDLTAA